MENINVRLTKDQLEEMDGQVRKHHFSSRSEYIRQALRVMSESYLDLSDDTVKSIERARKQNSIPHGEVEGLLGLK